MGILRGPVALTGEIGVKPVIKRMTTTDDLAAIIVAGYLNTNLNEGEALEPSDLLLVIYNYDEVLDTGDKGFFNVAISNGIITLSPDIAEGNVELPVVADDFAVFADTAGKIKDKGFSASDATKTKVMMADAAVIVGNLGSFSDTAGTVQDAALVALNVLSGGITGPDTNANLISFDVEVGFAALSGGAAVILHAGTGGKQYVVRDLKINLGTNFAGGDRLLLIEGSVIVEYSLIPSANLLTLANETWGSTALPFSTGFASNTPTSAGADLHILYSGGTADYTSGTFQVSGILERVA